MNLLWIFFYLFRLAFKLGKLFISIKFVESFVEQSMKAHPVNSIYGAAASSLRTTLPNYLTFIYLCAQTEHIAKDSFILYIFWLLLLPSRLLLLLSLKHASWFRLNEKKRNGKIFGWINCRCLTNTHFEINKLRKLLIKMLKQSAQHGMPWKYVRQC